MVKFCTEGHLEWDLKPPALLMAYRSTEHESMGYTRQDETTTGYLLLSWTTLKRGNAKKCTRVCE